MRTLRWADEAIADLEDIAVYLSERTPAASDRIQALIAQTALQLPDHPFLYPIYDTLVTWDYATLEPRPGLALDWSYPSPDKFVMNLRPGVLFHDGTPCDAEAVAFNLERGRSAPESNVKPDFATISKIEVTGPLQVTLTLNQPDTSLPLAFSDRTGMMCSPTAVKALGKEHDRKPVGAGPWKFVRWDDAEKVVVTRNEKYWNPEKPYLDGIEMSVILEVNTGLRSAVAGQNDFVYFLSPQQKAVIDRAKNLTPATGPTLYCVQLYINFGRKPFDDKRVRLALNYAIDREEFNKATMAGLSEPATLSLPKSHWAHDPEMAKYYTYDPDKARKLLAEAGYANGLDVLLACYPDQRSQQRVEVLIEQFRKVGIRINTFAGTIPQQTNAFFAEKKGDIYLSAWTGRPDPSQTYALMFGEGSFYNASRIAAVPELMPALMETKKYQDIPARKQAFAKLQKIVTENALVAPLLFQFEMDAYAHKVKGYQPNLLGKPKFENVWLEG
mgnify:CR=1 FL=1